MTTNTIDQFSSAEYLPFNFDINHVYALGLTYEEHLKEVGEKPGNPVVFIKDCQPSVGNKAEVAVPVSEKLLDAIDDLDTEKAQWLREQFSNMPCLLDYEVEVGMILLDDLSLEKLSDATYTPRVAYALVNDITARSVQIAGEGAQNKLEYWAASKSFPGFLPTADQIWIPRDSNLEQFPALTLETFVNGEKRQSSSTSQILYSPRQILQMAIKNSTKGYLCKHDMILTGTPSGIGLSIPRWKRRLASCLPSRLRVLSAIRSNAKNTKLLRQGDIVTVCGGVLGKQTVCIV